MSDESDIEKLYQDVHDKTKQFGLSEKFPVIPPVFKKYKSKKIPLSREFKESKVSVENTILSRESRRLYKGLVSIEDVSKLLFFANGFKNFFNSDEFGVSYQSTAPSAGSRHSIELYVILRNIKGVSDGIYHYDVENHALEVLEETTVPSMTIFKLFLKQDFTQANIILLMTSIHSRSSWKYGPRGYRFIHLDAGHIGQNVYLIGETMNLAVSAIGGWDDSIAEKLIHIDGKKEFMIYAMAIGKRKETP